MERIDHQLQDLAKIPPSQESEKRVTSIAVNREKGIIRIDQPQEWGGWIGTSFLIFLLPLSIILPQLLCSKGQCESYRVQLSIDWRSYINWHGFLVYFVYLAVLACVSILPIGKNVDGQQSKMGKLQYRLNGICSLISLLPILPVFLILTFSRIFFQGF